MSRSRRKTPIFGIAIATSEKDDKRKANRAFRRITHMICDDATRIEFDEFLEDNIEFPLVNEISDEWSFAKDGKVYNPPHRNIEKYMRK